MIDLNGTATFPTMPRETRKCKLCGETQVKKPINVIFLSDDKGFYILYKPKIFKHFIILKQFFGETLWCCENCPNAEREYDTTSKEIDSLETKCMA